MALLSLSLVVTFLLHLLITYVPTTRSTTTIKLDRETLNISHIPNLVLLLTLKRLQNVYDIWKCNAKNQLYIGCFVAKKPSGTCPADPCLNPTLTVWLSCNSNKQQHSSFSVTWWNVRLALMWAIPCLLFIESIYCFAITIPTSMATNKDNYMYVKYNHYAYM